MATTLEAPAVKLGEHGEPCASCGSPLAADQRYCVNCGARRGEPRLDFASHLGDGPGRGAPAAPATAGSATAGPGDGRDMTPLIAVGALALLGVMLAVGVLIGKGGNSTPVASSSPPVIRVAGGGTNASTPAGGGGKTVDASATAFRDDWPSGKDGYTVELGTLPKQGTTPADVATAKSDASSKGASAVGALDSDQYASLPGGKYVIYSGVYTTQADADKALKGLKSKFPAAQVVHVSTKGSGGSGSAGTGPAVSSVTSGSGSGSDTVTASKQALQQLNSANGDASQQALQHLPQNIATPGHAPKPDNKPPGGGGGGGITIR